VTDQGSWDRVQAALQKAMSELAVFTPEAAESAETALKDALTAARATTGDAPDAIHGNLGLCTDMTIVAAQFWERQRNNALLRAARANTHEHWVG
jgi:hypothetical protein